MKIDRYSKPIVALFFVLFLVIGLFVYRDYGVPWDEPQENQLLYDNVVRIEATLGLMTQKQASKYPDIATAGARDHGQAFYYPIGFYRMANPSMTTNQVFYLRHIYTYFICMFGLLCLYLLVKRLTSNWKYGLIAVIIAFLSPRMFGEYFYNYKDVVAMIGAIMVMHFFALLVEKDTKRWAVILGVVSAFVLNTRIMTVLFLLLAVVFYVVRKIALRSLNLKSFLIIGITAVSAMITYYVITPAMWSNPIGFIHIVVHGASNYAGWNGNVLYMGQIFSPKKHPLPWHYLPVTIAMTTPVFVLITFLFGLGRNIAEIFVRKAKYLASQSGMVGLILLFTLVSLIAPILMKSNVYNGWRHLYFIYSGMLVASVWGLKWFIENKAKILRGAAVIVFCIHITVMSAWIIVNHPYEYAYYNMASARYADTNFATDYWCLSTPNLVKMIMQNSAASKVYLINAGTSSLSGFSGRYGYENFMLTPEQAKRFHVITLAELKKMNTKNADDPNIEFYLMINTTYSELSARRGQHLYVDDGVNYNALPVTYEIRLTGGYPICMTYWLQPQNVLYMMQH